MASSAPLILRVVATSVNVANRAGEIIRDIMSKGDLGIVEKGKNDLQTEADRSAQRSIIASLSSQFPGIRIIGEEGESVSGDVPSDWKVTDSEPSVLGLSCPDNLKSIKEEEMVIWVDPLDGTSEYTQGLLDHVTVLIGVAVGNKAVGGVIHQPYYNYLKEGAPLGRTIWGIDGCGFGGFTVGSAPKDQRVICTTRSHLDATVQSALDAMTPDEILRVGGAGHKVLLLLEGKANAYVFASGGCKKWDTCAPEAILHAVGGRLTDMVKGEPYQYHAEVEHRNSGGVLGTAPGEDHSWYFSRIPESVRQLLSKPSSR
ncbi:3'(2'),5'-bisphosphate nucleotidase 1 isoform X2 [Ischnura elegans]|uniref:3'(2'),5'-bisphosphate nucleotidase 1 isoform X2 n=1 Tax=Ischnura elegans TaxID=197161 RepID=UPI001ED8BE3D|nr:3'(2'),5'-bisphosphate nucleotidase 1 isoform X2 [Ischnura elegans]